MWPFFLPRLRPNLIEVRHQRGLYLPEIDFWLDPQGARPRAFVSHAHADHFARHESVLCTQTTASLLRQRFNLAQNRIEALDYHTALTIDGFRLRMLPAGHIPGSAMLHITRTKDNATLLYTGDFKMRKGRTTPEAHFLNADTLVMETTFGLPFYKFPTRMEAEAQLLGFIHDCLADKRVPVLLAYSLGKTQEALAVLKDNGIPALLHSAAVSMTQACIEAGVEGLPEAVEFTGEAPEGHVIIAPPHAMKSKLYREIEGKRTAMLSGWALQPNARFRYGVDAMIPFSDHADHPALLECIQRVRPKRILTVHGFAKEFATELRAKGFDAWCASGGDQLELPIQKPAHRPATAARAGWHNRVLCSFADFTDLIRLMEQTGSRNSKVEFIANYLRSLEHDDELRIAAQWLATGNRKSPNLLNSRLLRHMLTSIPGSREERYRELLQNARDEVCAATTLLQELPLHPEALTLQKVQSLIEEFTGQSTSVEQLLKLSDQLLRLHPSESETLLRLMTGKLGSEIDRAMVEEAIAMCYDVSVKTLREALALQDNLGVVALSAKCGELKELKGSTQGRAKHEEAVVEQLPLVD